jgi:hypothetical protein
MEEPMTLDLKRLYQLRAAAERETTDGGLDDAEAFNAFAEAAIEALSLTGCVSLELTRLTQKVEQLEAEIKNLKSGLATADSGSCDSHSTLEKESK